MVLHRNYQQSECSAHWSFIKYDKVANIGIVKWYLENLALKYDLRVFIKYIKFDPSEGLVLSRPVRLWHKHHFASWIWRGQTPPEQQWFTKCLMDLLICYWTLMQVQTAWPCKAKLPQESQLFLNILSVISLKFAKKYHGLKLPSKLLVLHSPDEVPPGHQGF